MSEISDKLRARGDGYFEQRNGDCEWFCAIADRIDRELVELPKDAHGEYIRVGDTLDGYGKTIEVVEMRYGRGGWVLISRDGSDYADTFAFAHHHEPTVEDVLREFALACEDAGNAGPEVERIAAEYAARLRLAGDSGWQVTSDGA